MHRSTLPIPTASHLIQDLATQLSALNILQLPPESLEAVRLLQLRRLARRIETIIPGHFGHGFVRGEGGEGHGEKKCGECEESFHGGKVAGAASSVNQITTWPFPSCR